MAALAHARNSLTQFVTDSSSPLTFKKYLKTYLFSLSFYRTNQTISASEVIRHTCAIQIRLLLLLLTM